MLITADQIRAARAMVGWSQAKLAEQSGLARPTIVNIESESQAPELKTLVKIIDAFEAADIQFGLDEAVRRKSQNIKIYRGDNEFPKFFEKLYKKIKKKDAQIFVSNVDEREWMNVQEDFFVSEYIQNMTRIRNKTDFRILIREGDTFMPATDYATYRWTEKEHFMSVPFHVYQDYLSIFLFMDEPIIISVKDQKAADTFKETFLKQWDEAKPIPKNCKIEK